MPIERHSELSDATLIERTRLGDGDAYAVLHRRHSGSALALARRMSRNPSDADDLVAEGFTRVFAALQAGRGPDVAFRPYLLSTIRRLAYDRTNREQREAPSEVAEDVPVVGAGDPIIDGFERDAAAAAFSSLPERWRLVLWHTEVEGQTPSEIGELLGMSANSVAALAYRAREGLRQAYLAEHAPEPAGAGRDCRRVSGRLSGYVRGSLTPAREEHVRQHLDSCDSCRTSYLELATVNTAMPALVGVAVLGTAAPLYLAETGMLPKLLAILGSGSATGTAAGVGATGAVGAGATVAPAPREGSSSSTVAVIMAAVAAAVVGFVTVVTLGFAWAGSGGFGDEQAALSPPVDLGTAAPDPAPGPGPGSGSAEPGSPETTTTDGAGDPADPAPTSPTSPVPAPPAADPLPPLSRPDDGPRPNTVAPPTPGPTDPITPTTPTTTPPATTPPTTPPTTTEPTEPPTTTEPPAPAADYRIQIGSAGGLVRGRPGVLVADVVNVGDGADRPSRVSVSLQGASLRGLPYRDLGGPTTFAVPPPSDLVRDDLWDCSREGPGELICVGPILAPGETEALFIPVQVPTTSDEIVISATATPGGTGSPAPELRLPVDDSGFATRFATVDRATVATAGNAVVGCASTVRVCDSNDASPMIPIDVDGDPDTVTSSSASIPLPDDADILSATLWWGADTSAGTGGRPAGDRDARGRILFTDPTGRRTAVNAERVDDIGTRYQAVADVTDLVATGGGGTWTVADVQAGTGVNRYGGWFLTVVHGDPSAPRRSIAVLDGFSLVDSRSQVDFTVGGFQVPSTGSAAATIDVFTYEGDELITGDQLTVGGVDIADEANPLGNTFNSSATILGVPRTGMWPAPDRMLGIDLDRFDITDALEPGTRSTTMRFSTSGDLYLTGALAFSVDLQAPPARR